MASGPGDGESDLRLRIRTTKIGGLRQIDSRIGSRTKACDRQEGRKRRHVYGFAAWQTNATVRTAAGFVLARAVAGESEILSIGIDQRFEGLGLGWRLMQAAIREARMRDAEAMFLEVDEDNARARRLYEKLGFVKVGERKAYYADARGVRSAALVMRRDLR